MSRQSVILSELERKLQSVEGIRFVGFAPDDLIKAKVKTPAILICDEAESYTKMPANRIEVFWLVSVYVYVNSKINKLEKLNQIQNEIINSVMDGTCLNGSVVGINEAIEIDKGEPRFSGKIDYFAPGYYENFSLRKISFNLHYYNNLT